MNISTVTSPAYDQWVHAHRPIANLCADGSNFLNHEGKYCVFSRSEDDMAQVEKHYAQNSLLVWSILEADDEIMIVSGLDKINCLGIMITEVPADSSSDHCFISPRNESLRNRFDEMAALCPKANYQLVSENGHYDIFSDGDICHKINLLSGYRYYLTTDCHEGYEYYYGEPDNAKLFGLFKNTEHGMKQTHFAIHFYNNVAQAMGDIVNHENYYFLALVEPCGKIRIIRDFIQTGPNLEKVMWRKVVSLFTTYNKMPIFLQEHRTRRNTAQEMDAAKVIKKNVVDKLTSLCPVSDSANTQLDRELLRTKTKLFGFKYDVEKNHTDSGYFIQCFDSVNEALSNAAAMNDVYFVALIRENEQVETLIDNMGIGHELNYVDYVNCIEPFLMSLENGKCKVS